MANHRTGSRIFIIHLLRLTFHPFSSFSPIISLVTLTSRCLQFLLLKQVVFHCRSDTVRRFFKKIDSFFPFKNLNLSPTRDRRTQETRRPYHLTEMSIGTFVNVRVFVIFDGSRRGPISVSAIFYKIFSYKKILRLTDFQ